MEVQQKESNVVNFEVFGKNFASTKVKKQVRADRANSIWFDPHNYGFVKIYRVDPVQK